MSQLLETHSRRGGSTSEAGEVCRQRRLDSFDGGLAVEAPGNLFNKGNESPEHHITGIQPEGLGRGSTPVHPRFSPLAHFYNRRKAPKPDPERLIR